MRFLAEYGLFFAQVATLVVAILVVVGGLIALITKGKHKTKLEIKKLNKKYDEFAELLNAEVLTRKERKQITREKKQESKAHKRKRNIFIINFKGDIKASAVEALREEITAILLIAKKSDEIMVNLTSAGGMVNTYGLAASQLHRIKDKHIPLTVCVDKMAASGGYLMACVADQILAAPFAIIGSIGVVAQLPNFNRLLKKNNIDYEMITAGEYKRTLTILGENTDKARKKFQADVDEIHHHFKDYINDNRPIVDVDSVATGEHWLAKKALQLRLIDKLITSDDYLLQQNRDANLYEVQYQRKLSMLDKLTSSVQLGVEKIIDHCWQRDKETKFIS